MPAQALIDSDRCLVMSIDRESVARPLNTCATTYLGLGLVGGTHWRNVIAPEDVAAVESAMSLLADAVSGTSIDARLRREDGEYRWHALHLENPVTSDRVTSGGCVIIAVDVHEYKCTVRAIEQSEHRLQCALEASAIGAWECDMRAGIAHISGVLARLYGLDESVRTVPLDVLWDKVVPEQRALLRRAVFEGVAGRGPFEIEFEIGLSSDRPRWLRMRAETRDHAPNKASAATTVFGVTSDITADPTTRAMLARSERRYRELARSSAALIWSADQTGAMRPVEGEESEWEAFTGLPSQMLVGHGWLDAVHPVDRESLRDVWTEALQGDSVREATFRMRRADGVYRFMHARAVPMCDESGRLEEWFGTTKDVTDEHNAKAVSEARHVHLTLAMEAANIVIVTLSLQNYLVTIEGANVGARVRGQLPRQVKVAYDVALARIVRDDRQALEEGIRRLVSNEEDYADFEFRVRRADGEHWMTGSALLRRGNDGTPESIIASLLDISDRKKMELALRDAHKRKDEFLAMLAHELRNPLAPLRTGVTLLQRKAANKDPQEIIALMDRQISHLTRLVDDLLEVSRITQGRITLAREPLLVGAVVYAAAEAVASLVEERSQTLTVDVPRDTAWVFGDATRLSQIIVNVLNNSIKYTPRGGSISLRACADGSEVTIVVSDTGAGVAKELLPRIFELFTQGEQTLDRSKGGLGIGLSLVRKLVELHDGAISVASPGSGRGTTVTMRFPRLRTARPTVPAPPAPAAERRSTLRVLIVDDNRDAADSLGLVCEDEGHVVCVCYGATDALKRFASFYPDVALLDIGLPEMDGYELASRARAKGAREPVLVAITGYGQLDDRLRAQSAGFDHHFVKPVDISALLALLNSLQVGGSAERVPPGAS
ncbi:PAS domain-containing protein [Caballeronia sp. LZ025]|uniref:PAS domain-containing hybrid sensor histidine kinase/response regulator n=1 Tax=Caballeronia TaxID=1827195 RepID=UPI001FD08AC8|nr:MULTISPECIES: PAS domain-containing protein [Caballeronia]MDR5735953.1 PAS domain-containing protein [Caballeronia sp. LZ025]